MSESGQQRLGSVGEIWRYPVKSMQGESLSRADIAESGLVGDRAFALCDLETGQIASAKSPRRWPNLLDFSAAFIDPPVAGEPLPPVRISLPRGDDIRSDDPDVNASLSAAVGRQVTLVSSNPEGATVEQYVPPIDGADPEGSDLYRDVPNDVFGTGSLHDAAPVHVITTATLARLGELYEEGDFDGRRFRPNVVVATEGPARFMESEMDKRTMSVNNVRLRVTFPTMRCVMTTRPQPGLPRDLGILRTVTDHNRLQVLGLGRYPCAGVYGLVPQPGAIAVGDAVWLSDGP